MIDSLNLLDGDIQRGKLFGAEGYIADKYFACLRKLHVFPGRKPQERDKFNSALPFGPLIQSNAWFATLGNSSYNSFQASVRHVTGRLEFLAGYTFSKALSNASGYGESVNPLDHNERSLSAFDMTNNFVISYNYQLPFDKLVGPRRLTQGWRLSGITRFSTGIPVTLLASDDRSLLGTNGSGPSQLPIDTPNFSGGKLIFHNPRTGQPYLTPACLVRKYLGIRPRPHVWLDHLAAVAASTNSVDRVPYSLTAAQM